LRIEVRDALFGYPAGQAVLIRFPDGSHNVMTLDREHAVLAHGLPRATYEVTAQGPGIGLSATTSLSRPQAARVLLLSWLDLMVLGMCAGLFLVGLPMLSRRLARRQDRQRRPRSQPRAPAGTASGTAAPTRPGAQAADNNRRAHSEHGPAHPRQPTDGVRAPLPAANSSSPADEGVWP
jgi:hypothetical protein